MERTARLAVVGAMLLTAGGCEHRNGGITMEESPKPLRLASPAAEYRIDPATRAKVFAGFDVDALERLLASVTPERRAEILCYFLVPEDTADLGRGQLIQVKDPELQRLLEEVWAPMWDYVGATDEEIAANAFGYPGREIAQERRAARHRSLN
ncbi:MAG TPA: hypothetical protein VF541_22840 [Longimicrobium sp.]|jgi:hypothetical protein